MSFIFNSETTAFISGYIIYKGWAISKSDLTPIIFTVNAYMPTGILFHEFYEELCQNVGSNVSNMSLVIVYISQKESSFDNVAIFIKIGYYLRHTEEHH